MQEGWYEAVKPALRLASRLLTVKPLLDFWWAVIYRSERDFSIGEYTGSEFQLPARGETFPRAQALRAFEKLAEHSGHNLDLKNSVFNIVFKSLDDDAFGVVHCLGPNSGGFEAQAVRITLNRDMLESMLDFQRHSDYRNDKLRLASYLRTQLLLAVTLLHETAHAVQRIFHGSEAEEPYMDDDVYAELGYAWESRAFGGTISPFFHYLNSTAGLFMKSCPSHWPLATFDPNAEIFFDSHSPLRGEVTQVTAYPVVGKKLQELFMDEYWDTRQPTDTITFREEPIDVHDCSRTRQTVRHGHWDPVEGNES